MYIILLAILVLFFIFCYLLKPAKPTLEQTKPFYHRNFAHRGLHTKGKKVPENSIPAFKAAVDHNYGIELDLQFSKDKQIVVFHDDTLDRVCKINDRVDAYTYKELTEFGLHGSKEHMPLFSEVLKVVDGKVPLIVEFKNGPHNEELCEAAYAMLKDYKGDYCIESFNPSIVKWFRKNAPHILRGQLSSPPEALRKELSPKQAFLLGNTLSNFIARPNFIAYDKIRIPLSVRFAYQLGAMKVVWTARDTDDHTMLEEKNDAVIFEYYTPDSYFD